MSMSIVHNLAAMNANRMYGIVDKSKRKSAEKLSSGYKINRAADDAAGLTISESMRMKIRGLNQAADNVQDGISYCQVADGELAEVSDMINRIEELAVKSSNGTNTLQDRMAMDAEHQQLIKEMDRIFRSTEFNTLQIWPPQIVPQVSGEPTDYSLYLVQDGNGNEYYGGITYMNHNYSWKDLGIGWDDNTHTFTENREYTIDSKILVSGKDTPPGSGINTVIDDYESRKATAKFTLETKKGGTADTLVKNYSWSADDRGIYIDGVMLTGNGREGNTTWEGMGIIPGYIVPSGIYQFNYFGQTVEFEVPPEMDWGDFVDAFGNNRIDTKWTSKAMWNPSVDVSYIGSGVSTIYIDKDLGGKKREYCRSL